MIEKLISVIPNSEDTTVALSGGMDSRFILGLLMKRGISPKIYTLTSFEDGIVEEVSQKLNLTLVKNSVSPLNEFVYTLMSDARIYYRGGNYSRMCNTLHSKELLHVGIWSDPIIENAFKSAWKKPAQVKSVYKNFIWYNLLQKTADDRINGFTENVSKRDIFNILYDGLAFQKNYYDFPNRKQSSG